MNQPSTLFNIKLADFIRHLITLHPNIKTFEDMMRTCEVIVNIDQTFPIQIFKVSIYDLYKDKIYARDESFFLKNDFNEYSDTLQKNGYNFDIVKQLKDVWKYRSKKEKDEIWNYLILLCNISQNCEIKSLSKLSQWL
jgi:coenzyme F420-reducing hydrogenase alpha subunit